VFLALERVLDDRAFSHLMAQLPKDFQPLLPRGPNVEVVSTEAFVKRVADRAGISEEEAVRAIDAVLETLAMRIAGGEVEDLRMRLPVAVHPALDRGREVSGGRAMRMNLDQFVRRVCQRLGIARDRATDYVAAVLSVVRESVGDEEFRDVTAQLPDDIKGLISVAGGRSAR
jgi:uncharacterized protein (DUF2267 family)